MLDMAFKEIPGSSQKPSQETPRGGPRRLPREAPGGSLEAPRKLPGSSQKASQKAPRKLAGDAPADSMTPFK